MFFSSDPVFREIQRRFLRFNPPISISEHIDSIIEFGRTVSEGITFKPVSALKLRMEIAFTKASKYSNHPAFHWDDRKVWVFELAAMATDGEGYREIGTPSLHCAISDAKCNLHIDEFGFIAMTPFGEEFITPQSVRHIGDELIYRDKIRKNVIRALKFALPYQISEPASKLLDRTYLVLPGEADRYGFDINNKFKPRVGIGGKIWGNRTANLRFEYTCGNANCSDNQKMVWLSIH